MMEETQGEKQRSAASQAVLALREAMGKTQQTFAVEVMKTSIGTIARWETADPPRGDALLRLRSVAREAGLDHLAQWFERIWLQEVHRALGPGVRTLSVADGAGLLVASVSGEDAIAGAAVFLEALQHLDSDLEGGRYRANALAALAAFRGAIQRFGDPLGSAVADHHLRGLVRQGSNVTVTRGERAAKPATGGPSSKGQSPARKPPGKRKRLE
jgi:transcriptional regulator with XRE-family HTH domain